MAYIKKAPSPQRGVKRLAYEAIKASSHDLTYEDVWDRVRIWEPNSHITKKQIKAAVDNCVFSGNLMPVMGRGKKRTYRVATFAEYDKRKGNREQWVRNKRKQRAKARKPVAKPAPQIIRETVIREVPAKHQELVMERVFGAALAVAGGLAGGALVWLGLG